MTFDPFCECRRRESHHADDGGCSGFTRAGDQMEAAAMEIRAAASSVVQATDPFASLNPVVWLGTAQAVLADATAQVADLVRPLVERRRSVDDSPEFVALVDWLDAHDAEVRA